MQYQVKNFNEFKEKLKSDETLQQEFKENPQKAIEKFSVVPPLPDNWVYRIVVGALASVVVLITLGIVWRIIIGTPIEDKNIPTLLTALGSAAIGALAGILTPSPTQKN